MPAAAAMTTMAPPTEPSQLFPGLTRGKSLWRPKSEPKQYAPVSFSHRNTKTLSGIRYVYATPSDVALNASTLRSENGRAVYIWLIIVYAQLFIGSAFLA